jgi:trimethylamine:corrinoid methyltransferase-like protein
VHNNERWQPRLTEGNLLQAWMEITQGKDMCQRAKDLAKKILEDHHTVYAFEKKAEEIDKITKKA